MTQVGTRTIDTSHIPDEILQRWVLVESLNGDTLLNTLPEEVVNTIDDTKKLFEKCLSVKQTAYQDRHGNIIDENGNKLDSVQTQQIWIVKAANQDDVQIAAENIRIA